VVPRQESPRGVVDGDRGPVQLVEQALILRWNGTAWSADSNGVFGGALAAAATFPGAASEWAVGRGSGNQGLVLSHS